MAFTEGNATISVKIPARTIHALAAPVYCASIQTICIMPFKTSFADVVPTAGCAVTLPQKTTASVTVAGSPLRSTTHPANAFTAYT